MASLLPRAALLPRRIISRTGAATWPITPTPLTMRFASTKPVAKTQPIPPESPFFLNVPNPPQDQSLEATRGLSRVKGFLPQPRRIFAHRDSYKKPTSKWLNKAARRPTNARSQAEPATELEAWRRRMAEKRRQNMRSGIRDLWARKQRFDAKRVARREAKLAANKEAAMAEEPEDERLTRGTVNAGTLVTAVVPDPNRFEIAQAAAERTAGIAESKSQSRRDAIQTLYMNARSFIVDEAALEAAVNEQFADDYFEKIGKAGGGYLIQNIWDAQGTPLSTEKMLKELQGDSNTVIDSFTTENTRTIRRQKLVAEELTGGKMDA
ncbi:hypothetical protein F4861DRAFT_542248 [Xylaria intraflava]|nr:hypothetical protein F4861DRAFT_542248 [Xylaria intraflava]